MLLSYGYTLTKEGTCSTSFILVIIILAGSLSFETGIKRLNRTKKYIAVCWKARKIN